jgi:hypothetical protein
MLKFNALAAPPAHVDIRFECGWNHYCSVRESVTKIKGKAAVMEFEVSRKEGYCIIRAKEDVNIYADLSNLISIVEHNIRDGLVNFAVEFTPRSYLLSRSMAILVRSIEMTSEHNGSFAILNPSEQILDFLAVLDAKRKIRTFASEDDLLQSISNETHD